MSDIEDVSKHMSPEAKEEMVRRICDNVTSAETRRAEDVWRVLGDPRVAVHLPFRDDFSRMAEDHLGKTR